APRSHEVGVPLSAFTVESAASLSGPSWLRTQRRAAAARFEHAALPTDALEEWRYSRIDSLDLDQYQPLLAPPAGVSRPPLPDVNRLLSAIGPEATVVDTQDGYVVGIRASDPDVTVDVLASPDAAEVEVGDIAGEPDAFAILNRAFAPAPVRI